MKCVKNCKTWLLATGTGLALLMGILMSVNPAKFATLVVNVTRFFDAMLPILAVVALLKFIWSCPKSKCVNNKNNQIHQDNK